MKEYMSYSQLINDDKLDIRNLNDLALEGWEVVCSFGSYGSEFLLVRNIKKGRKKND